jgi:tripartite-type tricarboxylate transporter receptor subunit TctC
MTLFWRSICTALCLSVMTFAASQAQQSWPTRPITWIVPFPAGGTVDQPARLMAEYLRETLGWQIVVDNKPGASGMLGTQQVARAAADGYTWGFVFDTHLTNPTLQPHIAFDNRKDLQPVMMLGRVPFVIVTNPQQPYKTFADVIAAARVKPKSISYAIIGAGSLSHLTMVQLQGLHGYEVVAVPYRGGPPAVQDVLANHVPLYIGSPTLTLEHIRAGRLRALAYTGQARSVLLPDVPTLVEQGLGHFSAQAFIGVLGPAGVPQSILDRFNEELRKAVDQPKIQKWLVEVAGMEMAAGSAEDFQTYIDVETARWREVIETNKIELN